MNRFKLPLLALSGFLFIFTFSRPVYSKNLSAKTSSLHTSPQVSFGDILNGYNSSSSLSSDSEIDATNREKYKKIQDFLKIVEENGKKSLSEFYSQKQLQYPQQNSSNDNPNYLGVTDQNNPTQDTLADNIADYFISPLPTLHPKLADLLAQIDNTDTSLPLLYPTPENIGQADLTPLKSRYTIALLGDSMTETLGPGLPDLQNLLEEQYPHHDFVLLNYGQGSTDLEAGLYRLTNPTKYLGKDYPPLVHLKPDIIVVESFAYNHWGAQLDDLNRQWTTMINIVDTIKKYLPDTEIILSATISPNPLIYGDGVLNWPKNLKWDAAITTKAYLQNFINFASSSLLPLADAYHPSLNSDGHGDPKYINASDHLHPSPEGKLLISQKILDAIKNNNLIK